MKILTIKLLQIILIVAILAACSHKDEPEKPKTETQKKLVVLGGALTEIVYGLGQENHIVGADFSSLYPKETETLPKVGVWRFVTPEAVIGLSPTDVLAMPDTGPQTTLDKIKAAGINLFQPQANYSIDWTENAIVDIGNILSAKSEADSLLGVLAMDKDEHRQLKDSLSKKSDYSAMFVYVKGGRAFQIAGKGTTAGAMLDEVSIKNVSAELEEWANVGPEYTATKKPDFVIVSQAGVNSIGGLEALQNTPGIGDMLAVKEGRVYIVDELAFLGYGPRVVKEQIKLMQYALGVE